MRTNIVILIVAAIVISIMAFLYSKEIDESNQLINEVEYRDSLIDAMNKEMVEYDIKVSKKMETYKALSDSLISINESLVKRNINRQKSYEDIKNGDIDSIYVAVQELLISIDVP